MVIVFEQLWVAAFLKGLEIVSPKVAASVTDFGQGLVMKPQLDPKHLLVAAQEPEWKMGPKSEQLALTLYAVVAGIDFHAKYLFADLIVFVSQLDPMH